LFSHVSVNATLFAELGMMMKSFKEGIDAVLDLGTALTAALAIHVTASQCSSKLW